MSSCWHRSLLALLTAAACDRPHPQAIPSAPASVPASDDDRTLYALGSLLGKNLDGLQLTPAEVEQVKAGLGDRALGLPSPVDLAVFGPKAEQLSQARRHAALLADANAQREKDRAFVEAAAKAPGARVLDRHLIVATLDGGAGPSPKPLDRVRVSYAATLADGTAFDDTVKRGGSATLALNGAIPCLNTGLQQMKLGECARLTCPPELAYGDRGMPPRVPGGATTVFEITLLEINPPPAPAPPPLHGRQPKHQPAAGEK